MEKGRSVEKGEKGEEKGVAGRRDGILVSDVTAHGQPQPS